MGNVESVNIEVLSPDELAEQEKAGAFLDDEGTPEPNESPADGNQEETTTSAQDGEPVAEEGETDDSDGDVELNRKGEPKQDPLKATKAELTKLQQERAELRKQLAEERKKRIESQLKSFEKLSEDEEKELRSLDPDAYIEYLEKKKGYEKEEEALNAQLEQERILSQRDELERFFIDTFGVSVDFEKPVEEQPQVIQDKMKAGVFEKVDEYLVKNMIPENGKNYSAKQMSDAYRALFFDEILSDTKKGIREQAVNDIERATKGGSALDRAPKGDRSDLKSKKLDDYTQAEIDAMSEEEVERLLAAE